MKKKMKKCWVGVTKGIHQFFTPSEELWLKTVGFKPKSSRGMSHRETVTVDICLTDRKKKYLQRIDFIYVCKTRCGKHI